MTKVIPAPLVAIVALSTVAVVFDVSVPTVGGMGQLPDALPVFGIPAVPISLETLLIVAVVAKFAARGVSARITGLSDQSAELHGRLSGQLTGTH